MGEALTFGDYLTNGSDSSQAQQLKDISIAIGGEEAQQGYEAICQMTLSFLDTSFSDQNNNTFNNRLATIQSQLPSGFITIYSAEQ